MVASGERKESLDKIRRGERDELLANVRRLTQIVLDRLGEGIEDRSLDQGQIRMLGSLAVRSLRLWQEVVGKDREQQTGDLSAAVAELDRDLESVSREGVET